MKEERKFKYTSLTPFDGSVALLTGTIAMLIISLALGLVIKNLDVLNIVYSFLTQTAFACCAFFYAFKACKRDCPNITNYPQNAFNALGFTKKFTPRLALLSAVLPIFSILAFLPVSALIEYVFSLMGYYNPPGYADYRVSWENFVICIFALCLLPAFGEEMLMRGSLLHGLRSKGTFFAISISSLLFALLHGSPTQFIHQFLIGFIMAFIVLLTDCIWYSVIFHFVNNFTVITYEFAYYQTHATYVIPIWGYFIMFVLGLIGLSLLLYAFVKVYVKNTDFKERLQTEIEKDGKFRGFCKALFDTSDYKYKFYDDTRCYMLYITIGVLALIWFINTLVGWLR